MRENEPNGFIHRLYTFLQNRYNTIVTINTSHNMKAGDCMPSEKELNVNLLDKLDLLERLEMADNEGGYEKIKQQLAFEKKCIERKLYQKPPLTGTNQN